MLYGPGLGIEKKLPVEEKMGSSASWRRPAVRARPLQSGKVIWSAGP
jgi:hypothetical protein